jgi:hypothetical protein
MSDSVLIDRVPERRFTRSGRTYALKKSHRPVSADTV